MNNELEQQSVPTKKEERGGFLFDALEMFVWSLAILLLLFTFVLRLCRVDGSSMENTLFHGENLLLYSFLYEPEQDDIIVFHLTGEDNGLEKMLVKRVIATGGQTVNIDFIRRNGFSAERNCRHADKQQCCCQKFFHLLFPFFLNMKLKILSGKFPYLQDCLTN